MLFDNMMKNIQEYPKLYEVYLKKLAENYSVNHIHISTFKPSIFNSILIELGMENLMKEIILITYIQYEDSDTVLIKHRTEDAIKEKIHPHLHLSADIMNNTELKKQLIGGYNKKQVDDLFDFVQKDYLFIEVLLSQNKMLKDDIKKLRNR